MSQLIVEQNGQHVRASIEDLALTGTQSTAGVDALTETEYKAVRSNLAHGSAPKRSPAL